MNQFTQKLLSLDLLILAIQKIILVFANRIWKGGMDPESRRICCKNIFEIAHFRPNFEKT